MNASCQADTTHCQEIWFDKNNFEDLQHDCGNRVGLLGARHLLQSDFGGSDWQTIFAWLGQKLTGESDCLHNCYLDQEYPAFRINYWFSLFHKKSEIAKGQTICLEALSLQAESGIEINR